MIVNAEVRAIENGLHAFLNPDGSFTVRCVSKDHGKHRVTYEAVKKRGVWLLRTDCDCPAGLNRRMCLHAACVARRLERIGWARYEDGRWIVTDKALEAAK